MRGTIGAKFFGIGAQLIRVDHRWVVLAAIVTIKPSENERVLVSVRGLELFAGPGGKVDFVRLCRRAPCQDSCADYRSRSSHRAPLAIIPRTSGSRLSPHRGPLRC